MTASWVLSRAQTLLLQQVQTTVRPAMATASGAAATALRSARMRAPSDCDALRCARSVKPCCYVATVDCAARRAVVERQSTLASDGDVVLSAALELLSRLFVLVGFFFAGVSANQSITFFYLDTACHIIMGISHHNAKTSVRKPREHEMARMNHSLVFVTIHLPNRRATRATRRIITTRYEARA